MQWNQLVGSYGFQNNPKLGDLRLIQMDYDNNGDSIQLHSPIVTVPSQIPLIAGEGDVTAITFPDGGVQFYFVPTFRRNHSSCSCNVNSHRSCTPYPSNNEVWFVRSIPHTNVNTSIPPGYLNSPQLNPFGECPPYSPPNYVMNNSAPAYPEYYQKFHNDTWTSTTDIHYFYPSSRRPIYFQYCTETQTEASLHDTNPRQHGECSKPCHCEPNLRLKELKVDNTLCECHPQLQVKSSNSCMSVDNERNGSEQRRNKKQKKSVKMKKASKSKHVCVCKQEKTSDKFVTTYVDQATGQLQQDGRETQTEKITTASKLIDIKSKIYKPTIHNSNPSNTVIKNRSSSESSCSSGSCTCSGCASETERTVTE